MRKDFVQVAAREKAHDFARGNVLEQFIRLRIFIDPIGDVRDLELHRDADGDEADGFAVRAGGGTGGSVITDEEIFLLGVRDRPEDDASAFISFIRRVADSEGLNLFGAEAINLVNRPRQFEMRARPENSGGLAFQTAVAD